MIPKSSDAFADTPVPSESWQKLTDAERLKIVRDMVQEAPSGHLVIIAEAKADGQVILSFAEPVAADVRGGVLLDLEAYLKQTIDPSLAVWLEPLGDKNSLRNLRGIEVKSS